MNLSTARSEQRAREVGVRKVLGAGKSKLVGQFLGESLFLSLISAVLAILLIYVSLSAFNGIVEKQLSVDIFRPLHLGALLPVSYTHLLLTVLIIYLIKLPFKKWG